MDAGPFLDCCPCAWCLSEIEIILLYFYSIWHSRSKFETLTLIYLNVNGKLSTSQSLHMNVNFTFGNNSNFITLMQRLEHYSLKLEVFIEFLHNIFE